MSEDKYLNKYRNSSARAPWHDYNGGAYFITICTHNREHYFGEIVRNSSTTVGTVCTPSLRGEPQMILSAIGQYAHEQFANVTTHYPYAEIPLFVIMPDHIHAIVVVDGDKTQKTSDRGRDGVHTVSTAQTAPAPQRWKSSVVDKTMQTISHHKGPLSVVIGGLKRAITRHAHENNIPFAWQTRFYDRIIRNQDEMNRIATYIEQNMANWRGDES